MKSRNRQIKEKKLLGKDEVYHGALEDILLGKEQRGASARLVYWLHFTTSTSKDVQHLECTYLY